MRRLFLSKLVPDAPPEPKIDRPATEKEIARAAMVSMFGPRTAGWLLFQHRKQLHLRGAIDFVVPAKPNKVMAEKLRWFFVAMDFLRRRDGWAVDIFAAKGKRTFRVRWLGWKLWGVQKAEKPS